MHRPAGRAASGPGGAGLPRVAAGGRQRLRQPVGRQRRGGLPDQGDELRQLPPAADLARPARRDDLVDQLGQDERVRVLHEREGSPEDAAVALP